MWWMLRSAHISKAVSISLEKGLDLGKENQVMMFGVTEELLLGFGKINTVIF